MNAALPPPEPAAARAPPVATEARWHVCLLGGLRLSDGQTQFHRLPSRAIVALLSRLALYPQRAHAREELLELLWPGVELTVGRNRLRQALFTLRTLLEPPGAITSPVVLADRLSVHAAPNAFSCDVHQFERAVRAGHAAEARALYRGELLPGFYDDWVNEERRRLAALFDRLAAGGIEAAPTTALRFADAAAPRTAERPGTRLLPVYLTRFFGRDADSARLRHEVLDHRLVTLLGPGGSGKTRLAVELAAALKTSAGMPVAPFDMVAFVPWVGCHTRAEALGALLTALRQPPRGDDPFDSIEVALGGRRVLLVLDNFEQLAGQAEDLVARLAALLPDLHLLVTSRRVLGLDGERVCVVPPLGLPATGVALNEAAMNPSLALFVDRARAARGDFHVGPRNVGALIELVHLLEGLPLAIELAAARVRSIAPADMVALLRAARTEPTGAALELLARSGPRAGSDPRHASMLRVIEWSWQLLAPAQAQLLAALTVFHGGFTAQAVGGVCGLAAGRAAIALDELLAHSLLRTGETDGGAQRFSLFEPIREYAAAQLDAARASALRASHRAWLTAWAKAMPPTPSLAEVRAEMPNLRAAIASAQADGVPEDAVQLMLPLHRVLENVELSADALVLLECAVARCTDATLRSRGHTLLGPLLFTAGRGTDALRHAELGLNLVPAEPALRARALHAAARVRWRATRDASGLTTLLEEALALAEAAGEIEVQAGVYALRAFIANARHGDHAGAEALHARALTLWEALGNQHAIDSGRYNLATSAQYAGRNAEVLERLADITGSARRLQDWRRLSQSLNVRGNALSALRRWGEAVQTYCECIQLAWDGMAAHDLAYGLWNLPRALAHVRQPEAALQLAAFAAHFWESRFGALGPSDLHYLRLVRRLATRSIDAATSERLWAAGRRLSTPDAVALALQAGNEAP